MSRRKEQRKLQRHVGPSDFQRVLHSPGVVGVSVTRAGRADLDRWLRGRPGPYLEVDVLEREYVGRAALVFETRDGEPHLHAMGWDEPGRITAAFLLQSFTAFANAELDSSGSPEPELPRAEA